MSAELQVALAFFAVLGGGLVAVLSAYMARQSARDQARDSFADARQLQLRDRAIHELALARALDFELATNAASASSRLEGGGVALLTRSAYESARQLEMPDELMALVALAYEEAEIYNATVLMMRTSVLTDPETAANARAALRPADTKKAFEDAIGALRRHKVFEQLKAAVNEASASTSGRG